MGSHVAAFYAEAEPRISDVIYVETPQLAPARQHLTKNQHRIVLLHGEFYPLCRFDIEARGRSYAGERRRLHVFKLSARRLMAGVAAALETIVAQ